MRDQTIYVVEEQLLSGGWFACDLAITRDDGRAALAQAKADYDRPQRLAKYQFVEQVR